MFFVLPWRNRSIIGTDWFHFEGDIEKFTISEEHCKNFIDKFNTALPDAKLRMRDVTYAHWGFVPCKFHSKKYNGIPHISKKSRIIDVSKNKKARIINAIGIKYTTAGELANEVLKYVGHRSEKKYKRNLKLIGGEFDDFKSFRESAKRRWSDLAECEIFDRLLTNYGSEIERLIELITTSHNKNKCYLTKDTAIKAETNFALKQEMALKLGDVIFRRTDLGSAGIPSDSVLLAVAKSMAKELKWPNYRISREIQEVKDAYPSFIK